MQPRFRQRGYSMSNDSATPSGGGKHHYPYTDFYERFDKYDKDEIRKICRTLSEGDKVLINKRERPLEVEVVEDLRGNEPVEIGDTGHALKVGPTSGWWVHLRGHGTRYGIHVREKDSTCVHNLIWPSGEQCVGYIDVVSDGKIVEPEIRSSVTASDVLDGDVR